MKKKFLSGFSLLQMLIVIAILGLLAALGIPTLHAAENFQPNYWKNVLTNGAVFISPGQTFTLTNSAPFTLRQGRGLAVFPLWVGTNAGSVSNVILRAEVTADGTNYSTTQPYQTTNALNGTTATRPFFLFSAAQLNNVRAIKFTSVISTNLVSCILSNLVLSQDNQ